MVHLFDILDHSTFLGNRPPTPPLMQHFALSDNIIVKYVEFGEG